MFKDLVVVVTGGAQGIGKGIVLAYARNGANVVIADVNKELGQQLEMDLLAQGHSVLFVETDVTKEQDIVSLMQKVVDHFGTIHILINNAGKFQHKSLYDLTLDEWNDMIQTNLTSFSGYPHPLKEVKASGGCHGIGKEFFVQAQSRFRTQLCEA